jgi:hypothetical protein
MTPDVFLTRIVKPAVLFVSEAIAIPASDEATVLLMTIAGQESDWRARRQIGGPARSFWQFEEGGGVAELFQVTSVRLETICDILAIPFDQATVFEAMAWNDTLACAMARLLLWQDPAPLPEVGAKKAAYSYYERNWRPGAPRPDAWSGYYEQSLAAMESGPVFHITS